MLNYIRKKYCLQPLRWSPSPSFIKWQLPVPTPSVITVFELSLMDSTAPGKISLTEKITLKWNRLNGFWTVLSQPRICVPPYWIADKLRSSRHLLALKMEEVSAFKVPRLCSKSSDLPRFDAYFAHLMRAGSCQFVYVLAWGFEPLFLSQTIRQALLLQPQLPSCHQH